MATKKDLQEQELVFLLGAGASVNAGMPTVAELTKKLRQSLLEMSNVDGLLCPELGQIFDLFAKGNPSLAENYERFFEWVAFLTYAHMGPYRNFCEIKIDPRLLQKMADIRCVIEGEIAKILGSYRTNADYFTHFEDFIPESGRLRIFTLNYDCCLEDSCFKAGIDVTTGFDPHTKKWNPLLFDKEGQGINLYKLHGSLRWFGTRDLTRSDDRFQVHFELMELIPEDTGSLAPHLKVTSRPELILGPGSKVQVDDPYLTLLYEFHLALQQAKVCVVIGFSYGDDHVKTMLERAFDTGLSILDVNPSNVIRSPFLGEKARYHLLRKEAKEALEGKVLVKAIHEFAQDVKFI
jgi:hypothetical protein